MLVWSCLSVEVADTSTVGLTTRQWLDSLWQQALTSIGKVMKQQLARCSTASMIREVKQLIVDFNATLNAHTYSVNRLTDVLLQVRSRYQAVLVVAASEAFKAILAEDNLTKSLQSCLVLRLSPSAGQSPAFMLKCGSSLT
eukprot:m.159972 g.159972  ORF g.159972 m.159972 type:complete len:141 (+) comp16492_c0_seq19:1067-1489(+)